MRSPRRFISSLLLLGALACFPCVCNATESSSAVLDRLMAAAWARARLQPAALADDAEFVRRIYLDLIGRIPTRDEIVRFYADQDRHKRSKLIDQWLVGGEFASHWRENSNVL